VTSPSFDIAALELYLPLIAGAQVEIARREEVIDGQRLAALLEQSKATVMQATPSGWRLLLEGGWQGRPLKALCGGEALAPDLAAALRGRGVELWNMYGPTETTIWSSVAYLGEGAEVSLASRSTTPRCNCSTQRASWFRSAAAANCASAAPISRAAI
jgi:non-ribosomal peptide synthetase component F